MKKIVTIKNIVLNITIINLIFLSFSGCSIYNVSQNQPLDRVQYNKANKALSTGKATIFLGTSDLNEYDVFSKILFNATYRGIYMSFYENSQNVFFAPMQHSILYGITTENRLSKANKGEIFKIDSSNITCSNHKCEIYAKKSVYYIRMFEADAGNVDFEYINFENLKKKYIKAIKEYDTSLTLSPQDRYIERFIPISLIFQSIDNAKTKEDLNKVKKLYSYIWKQQNIAGSQEEEFKEAIKWKQFLLDYNKAFFGTLIAKKHFLHEYNMHNIFRITTNSLNIRKGPSTNFKIIGKYLKNNTFQVLTRDHSWGLTSKGWIYMKYVKKDVPYKYKEKINKIKTQVFNINRKGVLENSSIKVVKTYYNKHSSDTNVKNRLLDLYRQQNTADSFYEAYRLSKDVSDLKQFLLQIESIKHLNKYRFKDNALVKEKYAVLYRIMNTSSSYLKAFSYSKSKDDIKQAYKLAKTKDEKENVEYTLIKYSGVEKVFKISGTLQGNKKSGSATNEAKALIIRVVQSEGKAKINIKISQNKDSKIQLKYGSYRVKIKIKLQLVYHTVAFGIGMSDNEYKEKSFWIDLNKTNNYINTKTIDFGKITQDMHGEMLFKVSKKLENINPIITFEDIELVWEK